MVNAIETVLILRHLQRWPSPARVDGHTRCGVTHTIGPEALVRESALITRTLVDLYKIKTTEVQKTCSNYLAGLSLLTPG